VQTAIDNGSPIKIQWDQNLQTADYLVVPKGTQNKEQAMKLVAYIVSGANNHRISNFINYAPVNEESIPKLDKEVASKLPTAYRDTGVPYNDEWWDDNREKTTERFNEWLLG
jgi:putative spermidine/putrescine transport system substrate-binding protein